MRTQLRLFSLIAALVLPIAIWANVIVKGHVTYPNGQPANGYKVYIQTDSSATACIANHAKYTNPNGVYQDTLVCNSRIVHVTVWIVDCQNKIVAHYLETTSTNILEANFVVCSYDKCNADFTWYPITNELNTIRFHSETSIASPGDSIISRKWIYGDGDSAIGNAIAPDHHYKNAGHYTACLFIKTKYGCESHVCKEINIAPNLHNCHAQFTYLPITGTPNIVGYIHFNGQPSIAGTGDSIIQYSWKFGDGGTASTKDPYHTYTKAGNYLACLTIVCKSGCTDSICVSIVIATPPPTTCSANFTFADNGLIGHFNSSQIKVSAGDSIISRNWTFGDGQTLSGNVVSPLHQYRTGGNYQACLKVVTRLGCASEYCKTVHIAGDSIVSNPEFIRIVSVYPNPATTQFNTIIYSRYNNVDATLEIYDVYGTLKWSSKKVLSQANNTISIPISQLMSGPYIFKVTTIYGIDSKRFFKL